jgi:hypothetical protein
MRMRLASIALVFLLMGGCSSGGRNNRSDGGGGGGGVDLGSTFPTDGFVTPEECSDAAKKIYLVDQNGTFFSYLPNQTTISQSTLVSVGSLSCPAGTGARPFSMSVDRAGTAWVLYVQRSPFSGAVPAIFKVSTQNAACTATSFALSNGFEQFGMGFVADVPGGSTETLFIAGGAASDNGPSATTHLGTLNTTTLATTRLYQIAGNPELTGTGDAKLWGFFPDSFNPRIAEINRASGQESNEIPLSTLAGIPTAWAFAFWGGEFWVFLQRTTDQSTIVYRVTKSGSVDSYALPGRTIVGAGVSTCAPTSPINYLI